MKVFLLEDDETRCSQIEAILSDSSIKVVVAHSASEAKKCFAEFAPYSIMLLDYDLGDGASGLNFVGWLLKHHKENLSESTIFIHTFHTRAGYQMAEALCEAGITRVSRQPFNDGLTIWLKGVNDGEAAKRRKEGRVAQEASFRVHPLQHGTQR